jgi:hypothetical protein
MDVANVCNNKKFTIKLSQVSVIKVSRNIKRVERKCLLINSP